MSDREEHLLRLKKRISASETRIDELRQRRHELQSKHATAADVQRGRERMLQAALHAVAAQLAVIDQLESCAQASESAARAHERAASGASSDLAALAHLHVAENHRTDARRYRDRVKDYHATARQSAATD